jgi:hypothetical protein
MVDVTMRIIFADGAAPAQTFEINEQLPEPRDIDSEKRMWEYLARELKKETVFGPHYEALPVISDFLQSANQTFNMNEFSASTYFDRRNTLLTWYEISKAVTKSKFKLAESRAYKEIEQSLAKSDAEREQLYRLHIPKMDCFNLATLNLVRIEDLLLRLLFENLGASLVPVDLKKPNWQRSVKWDKIIDGLKKRRGRSMSWWERMRDRIAQLLGHSNANPHLEALTEEEFEAVIRILREFRSPHFTSQYLRYRDRMTHGFMPYVDFAELYFSTEDRVGTPIFDSRGKRKGTKWRISAMSTTPEYEFLGLYESGAKTLAHWLGLLRRLRAMPRFGPAATR